MLLLVDLPAVRVLLSVDLAFLLLVERATIGDAFVVNLLGDTRLIGVGASSFWLEVSWPLRKPFATRCCWLASRLSMAFGLTVLPLWLSLYICWLAAFCSRFTCCFS